METTIRILKYILAIVVVAVLGGLASWFFFVRAHQASTAATDAGRGLNVPTPSATSTVGSTAENTAIANTASTSTEPLANTAHPTQRLWRADQGPIAGFSFITEPKGATTSADIFFAERANGYVFDADAAAQNVLRLTNTLIPKTYEAIFAPKGGVVLMRTLESGTIQTLLANFPTPASTSTFPQNLGGPTIAQGIRAIAVDPDPKSNQLMYLAPAAGGTGGYLSSLGNAKPKQIFSSPISSWRPMIAGGKIILLENPTDGLPGYAYTLGSSGSLSLYAGPLPGLMILPHPTQSALLFSISSGGRLTLYAQVGKSAPVALSIATVAEKCAWAPGKNLVAYCAVPQSAVPTGFIDLWYQGALHTSDSWWQIDVANGTATELYTPQQSFDVHDPQVDPSGNYIAFTNGADMSLWVLRIVQ